MRITFERVEEIMKMEAKEIINRSSLYRENDQLVLTFCTHDDGTGDVEVNLSTGRMEGEGWVKYIGLEKAGEVRTALALMGIFSKRRAQNV